MPIVDFTFTLNGNAYTGFIKIDKVIGDIFQDAQQTQKSLSSMIKEAMKFDAFSALVDKVSQAFKPLVGTSLEFEQQQANLRTLLNGDAEATENLVGKIREYGKSTTYSKGVLLEAQKTMMSFGIEAGVAFSKLKNIGDIAMGDSQKMQKLSLAFGQMSSTGALAGQDLQQMVNAGFNPLEIISRKTGESMSELKDKMSKGAISAELVAQAFEWATEEGGLFYQGAEMASETTAGKMAKMNETIDDMKIKLFEATGGLTAWLAELENIIDPLSKIYPLVYGLGNNIVTSIKWCKSHWGGFVAAVKNGISIVKVKMATMKLSIQIAGGFFSWLSKTAKKACGRISMAIMKIPIVGWIAAAVAAVIALVTILWNKSEGFRKLVFGVFESIKAIFNNIWVIIKAVATMIWEVVLKPYFTLVKNIFITIWDAIKSFIDWIVSVAQTVWETIVNVATTIGDFFVGIWDWIVEKFQAVIDWISEKLGDVGSWLKEHILAPVTDVFSKLWDIIKGVFGKIKNKLNDILAPIITLWNKAFKKDQIKNVKVAYQEGEAKGEESWAASQEGKKKTAEGVKAETAVLTPPQSAIPQAGTLSGGNLGKTSGTSVGKAQQIHINIGSMVGTMNFNGGMSDNHTLVERQLAEMMARILGMAETAV
ncbi:MAG: tape measure protein [Bacteroidales bacterium]|nr:tape measure protein [Bacteroidales bacterium]